MIEKTGIAVDLSKYPDNRDEIIAIMEWMYGRDIIHTSGRYIALNRSFGKYLVMSNMPWEAEQLITLEELRNIAAFYGYGGGE